MISRFFFPDALPASGEVVLPDALAHHAARVLRLRDGDAVALFDGRGGESAARLRVRGKAWYAELGERCEDDRESPLGLVLVQALASGDKMDWIVQKATELGATAIVPVAAERSVLRLAGERAEKRVAHWRQVAVAACEQSGRNRVPEVWPLSSLHEHLATHRDAHRLVLAPGGATRLAALPPPAGALELVVGPEGGWSEAELDLFEALKCLRLSLGPRVLRTETAGLAALAAIQAQWGDL